MHNPPLILVIDDESDLLEIASIRLKSAGYAVETAGDAAAGFKAAGKLLPDLILLDINMPRVNGTEAFLDFKKDKAFEDTKIAFFSNMSVPWPGVSSREKFAKELGAVGFIDKAKDLDILEQRVGQILNAK